MVLQIQAVFLELTSESFKYQCSEFLTYVLLLAWGIFWDKEKESFPFREFFFCYRYLPEKISDHRFDQFSIIITN